MDPADPTAFLPDESPQMYIGPGLSASAPAGPCVPEVVRSQDDAAMSALAGAGVLLVPAAAMSTRRRARARVGTPSAPS